MKLKKFQAAFGPLQWSPWLHADQMLLWGWGLQTPLLGSSFGDFMRAPQWGGDEREEEKARLWVPTPDRTRDPLVLLSFIH